MPGNTAALTQPGESALYSPAPGQHDEALLTGQLAHHFRPQAGNGGRLSDQRALVAAVGPDQCKSGARALASASTAPAPTGARILATSTYTASGNLSVLTTV